jgi:hypothetical protein
MGSCGLHSSGSGQQQVVKATMNPRAVRVTAASSADCQGVASDKKTAYGVTTGWSPRPVSICAVANV